MYKISSLIIGFLFCIGIAHASAEELNYNLIHLSAGSEIDVDNDISIVLMNAYAEKNSAREASDSVNTDMEWALKLCSQYSMVEAKTMNYQTRPNYNKTRTITGWHASQQLRLESPDIENLSKLVGRLQDQLNISSMRFEVSTEKRKKAVEAMTVKALEEFTTKAQLITKTIGASDFRIVNLNIGENSPPRPYQRGFQAESMSLAKSTAPAVQAGESRILVQVNGSIQLVF